MINLASLTMTGKVRAYFTGNSVAGDGVALPTNWDFSFIETLSLIANGGIITQPFVNYKLLGNILNDVHGDQMSDNKRSALQGSLPQPLQSRGSSVAPANQGGWLPFSINNWISATQTMAPSYLSTNLLGDLELRLTMADESIVASGSTVDGSSITSAKSWEMADINFYIETASIGNNLVDQAVAAKLAAGEPINVPFENVFSFSQTNSGGTFNQRFSVSSQSVNKILVTCQHNVDIQNSGQKTFVNGIPTAFVRRSLGATSAQFSVNNQYSPNYQIDSGVNNGYNPIDETNTQAYNFSNALVETRAALDIEDYDYDCTDKLCSTTQMPQEFFGAGRWAFNEPPVQPGSGQLFTKSSSDPFGEAAVSVTTLTADNYNFPVLVKIETAGATDNWASMGFSSNTATVGATFWAYGPGNDGGGVAGTVKVQGEGELASTSYWEPYVHKYPLKTYLEDKFVLATSFDFDVADKDRLVSGINTLGSNAQMFYNQIGTGNTENQSTIFVLCTSMVQIYAGATLKIIQ
jgi:hypothetical protein